MSAHGLLFVLLTAALTVVANLLLRTGIFAAAGFAAGSARGGVGGGRPRGGRVGARAAVPRAALHGGIPALLPRQRRLVPGSGDRAPESGLSAARELHVHAGDGRRSDPL